MIVESCLITGAILIVLIAAAHSYLGERYILSRLLRRTELPHLFGSDSFTRQTLRFAWHLTSIAWLCVAVILIAFSLDDFQLTRSITLQAISITFLLNALLTFIATRGRHLAWIVFLAISLAAWLAIG